MTFFTLLSNATPPRLARLVSNAACEFALVNGREPSGVELVLLSHQARLTFNAERENERAERVANERVRGPTCAIAGTCAPENVCNAKFALPADNWVLVAPKGEWPNEGHGKPVVQILDDESIQAMHNRFQEQKKEPQWGGLLCDEEHQSQNGSSRALAWMDDSQARSDGLWGHLALTNDGKNAIEGGSLRYISPVWKRVHLEHVDGKPDNYLRPLVLDSIGITNVPAISPQRPITKIV